MKSLLKGRFLATDYKVWRVDKTGRLITTGLFCCGPSVRRGVLQADWSYLCKGEVLKGDYAAPLYRRGNAHSKYYT